MKKRFEGHVAPNGFYVLDTFTGEVKFIPHGDEFTKSPLVISQKDQSIAKPVDKNQFDDFENEIITSYPYPIAKPFYDLLSESDPRVQCKLMVDTFTAVLKYMALQLASEYIRETDLKNVQIHQTLVKDLSRPLISAWNLLISRALKVFKENDVKLFSPEISKAYDTLERKCKDPFLINSTYSDENGELRTKTKKLGKIQALINYRNSLAHGFNQSKQKAQSEYKTYYPLLRDILENTRFLSRYTLWHVESAKEGIKGVRLMGSNPSKKKMNFDYKGFDPSISPLFMINDASGDILPLYAFFDVDEASEYNLPDLGKDVFVFEGNTKNTVIYISSSGEHLEKTSRFHHWKDLLAQKDMEVKWIDDKKMSIEDLVGVSKHVSSIGIQTLISAGKYLRDATVERNDLNSFLNNFCASKYNGFILGGESGIGKSTLLAKRTEQWIEDGNPVVFYRASSLSDHEISQRFLRDCALKIGYLEDFLSVADAIFSNSDKCFYLVIDALNEYSGKTEDLIRSIEAMVSQASNYSWFKIVTSIRDSVYNRLTINFGETAFNNYFFTEEEIDGDKKKSIIIRLQPLKNEFIRELYDAYKNYKYKDDWTADDEGIYVSRPLNDFEEIEPDGSTFQLLRSPLMARLIMSAFHRAKLPSNLKSEEAMRLYIENIVQEKTKESNGYIERTRFLKLLVSEMDKINSERIDRDELSKIDYFKPHLFNSQKDSPYVQLLDIGVLLEEWENDICYSRFAFDRLLEYLLAEHHWPKTTGIDDLKELCIRLPEFKILQGSVQQLIYRFCLNGQLHILAEIVDISDDVPIIQPYIILITESLLMTMAKEDHSLFIKVINKFAEIPGKTDLIILKTLCGNLLSQGYLKAFYAAQKIAKKEAIALKDNRVLVELSLNESQAHLTSGEYTEAEKLLKQTLKLSEKINFPKGIIISLRKLGTLAWRKSDNALSMDYFLKGLTLSKENNLKILSAGFLNNIAVLTKSSGEIEKAEKLYNESLKIKKELNDKKGIAICLNNLGIMKKDQGNVSEAEKLYNESLEITRELGDKKGIASSLKSIANLKKDQGNISEAEKLQNESLEIRRELGDKQGIAENLNSIANLKKDQGNISEAEKLYNESLKIRRELGDKKGIAYTLNSIGLLQLNVGDLLNANKTFNQALKLFKALSDQKNSCSTLNFLGRTNFELDNISNAKKQFEMALSIANQISYTEAYWGAMHSISILLYEYNKDELISLKIDKPNGDSKRINSLYQNIQLIVICCQAKTSPKKIIAKINSVIQTKLEFITNEVAEMPVFALYAASKTLLNLGLIDDGNKYAKDALNFIGNKNSRIKKELEKITHS